MKKAIILTLLALGMCNMLQAQKENAIDPPSKAYKNSIRIHPLNLLVSQIGFSYERVIKSNRSLNFTLIQSFKEIDRPARVADYSYYGIEGEIDYRFYLKHNAPKGWFVSPGISATTESESYTSSFDRKEIDFKRSTVAVGIEGGYQWIFKQGITIGTSIGADYEVEFGENGTEYNIEPRLQFSVGYTW